jgi:CheY-like chemotaxis protein
MISSDAIILLADDDDGHASLITRNLRRASLINPIERFVDGQELLDFLYKRDAVRSREDRIAYVLLLDIRMPKVDGLQVLEIIKSDPQLSAMPIYMLTTTDDPREVERCYQLGCNSYTVKPVDYDQFSRTIFALGAFVAHIQVPHLETLIKKPLEQYSNDG